MFGLALRRRAATWLRPLSWQLDNCHPSAFRGQAVRGGLYDLHRDHVMAVDVVRCASLVAHLDKLLRAR
jgi:hypothetical protein